MLSLGVIKTTLYFENCAKRFTSDATAYCNTIDFFYILVVDVPLDGLKCHKVLSFL
jgi:hypothetical protein